MIPEPKKWVSSSEPKKWVLVSLCYLHFSHKTLWGKQVACNGERVSFWLWRFHVLVKQTPGSMTEFLHRCRARTGQ